MDVVGAWREDTPGVSAFVDPRRWEVPGNPMWGEVEMSEGMIPVLRSFPFFADLGDDVVRAIAEQTISRTLSRNAILFRKGEPCHGLYILIEGRVQIYRASSDGREQVLHIEGPGRPIAELPLFDGGPYPASARALENSRLLYLSRDAFQRLCHSHPEIAEAVIVELGRRLRRMVGLVEKVTLKDVRARVAATLVEVAEARGAMRDGGVFSLPQTQEELARGLATTREGVARALAGLRKAGTIAQEGARVEILDAVALESAARGVTGATSR